MLAVFAFVIATTVSNNNAGALAQPALSREFGAGPADVGWIVFGFSTAFAIATAIWGGLARRFGLGPCLAVGLVLLSSGSLAAALAPSLPVLIGARIVQGLGAGAIPTLSHSTVSRMFEGRARAEALGIIVGSVGLGLALGPLLGGIALDLFGWRGPMAFGIIVAPAAFVLARAGGGGDPSARIDVRGAVLVAVTVAAATFTLNRLPVLGVSVPTVISAALLVGGAVLLARRSVRPDAFVPRRIVADPAYTRVVVLGMLGMMAFLGSLVLVPIVAARVHGLDGIALGLIILPLAAGGAVASHQNARVQAAIGRRRTSLVSLCSLALGSILLGVLGPAAPPPVTAIALVPLGVGFGLLQSPLVNEISNAFDDRDRPAALGLYNLGFFLGGASGAAIATALVQSGVELPVFRASAVPGFTTTELALAVAPLVAIVLLLGQMRQARVSALRAS